MKHLFSTLFLLIFSPLVLVSAAPFAQRTATPSFLPTPVPTPTLFPRAIVKRKDDVIVNVGAVTVMTTVVEAAKPTTVFVEYTTEGKVITSKVISTEIETVQTVVTQTAVETQIVKETVQQGVTIPITVITTGYQIDIQTEVVEIQSTVLETKVNVVTNTILGFEKVDTETVVETKTAAGQEKPTLTATAQEGEPTPSKSVDDGQYIPEETATSASTKGDKSSSAVTALPTSAGGTNLNLTNSVDADSDASADVSNSNTNTNSVNVTLSSALTDADAAKSWVTQGNNGWYLGIGIFVIVLIILGIIVLICKSGNSSSSGAPSSQSVFVQNPQTTARNGGGGGGMNPQPVMASLASRPGRSQRKEYAEVGRRGEESSDLSESSGAEDLSRRKSRARSAEGGGGYGRSSVGRSTSQRSRR